MVRYMKRQRGKPLGKTLLTEGLLRTELPIHQIYSASCTLAMY
jgi:hypothetical protein